MSLKFNWLKLINDYRAKKINNKDIQSALKINPILGYELDLLGRVLTRSPKDKLLKIAIISSNASQPICNAVRVALLKEGIFADLYEAPYASINAEIYSLNSGLYRFIPDIILLDIGFSAIEHLPHSSMTVDQMNDCVGLEVARISRIWDILTERLPVPVIQHTIVDPFISHTSIAERRSHWSNSLYINLLNNKLLEASPDLIYWCDIDWLSKKVGTLNWHDSKLNYHAKFSFSTKFLPEYTAYLGGALRQILRTTPKALILDCDNTLWGGVVGDDGVSGIRLGPESAEGEAYQSFCRYINELSNRGIIIGICSKNELENVKDVFVNHPHMTLQFKNISVIRCNWDDKAKNLREIAKELNIDIGSLVFVDDNPAECELIRQQLPEVFVVNLDGDPSAFIDRLDSLCLFHSQKFSSEDLNRAKSYQARLESEKLKEQASDMESYLISLKMIAKIEFASKSHFQRLAQMESKTNQFNLGTRRLSLQQISNNASSGDGIVLAVSLSDRFADHGLVAYVSAKFIDDELQVTDWLMSCRVFSRTLENLTLNKLIELAKKKNASIISFFYTPTKKNHLMIAKFNEMEIFPDESNSGRWVLKSFDPQITYISLVENV